MSLTLQTVPFFQNTPVPFLVTISTGKFGETVDAIGPATDYTVGLKVFAADSGDAADPIITINTAPAIYYQENFAAFVLDTTTLQLGSTYPYHVYVVDTDGEEFVLEAGFLVPSSNLPVTS